MQKITPFLWFDSQAEEAVNYYVDIFNNNPGRQIESTVSTINRYYESSENASGKPKGSVMIVHFQLEGQEFTALNGGPHFKFSGAISFLVDCKTQAEVDYFWEKLGEGGETGQCGWINRDKFGVTWQIVPDALSELMSDPNEEKANRVMAAMLQMTKIDIDGLQRAYDGK